MKTLLLVLALAAGGAIAYVDSRPGWDDTGVTAGAVFLTCAALGAAAPQRPWLWALAVGAWTPLVAILTSRNYGALLALGVAFLGAYAGAWIRAVLGGARRV